MWLKLGKRVYDLFNNQRVEQEKNPQEEAAKLMKVAIVEIETAIKKHEVTLSQTTANQRDIAKQLQQHKNNSDRLYAEAAQQLKKRQEVLAQQLLNQKASEDKQVEQYTALLNNLNQVISQLEGQVGKMRWQLQEIKSREIMMVARMQNAKTQMELNDYLSELDNNLSFGLENEILKTEMQAEIVNGISESDKVLAETQGQFLLQQQMQELDKGLKEAEEREKKQREANQLKRIEQILGTTSEKDKKAAAEQERLKEEQKKKLAAELFDSQKEIALQTEREKQKKQQLLEEWQKNEETKTVVPAKEDKKQNLIEDFFNDKASNNKEKEKEKTDSEIAKEIVPPKDKKSLLDDFFNT
jgi:phage shock protein A